MLQKDEFSELTWSCWCTDQGHGQSLEESHSSRTHNGESPVTNAIHSLSSTCRCSAYLPMWCSPIYLYILLATFLYQQNPLFLHSHDMHQTLRGASPFPVPELETIPVHVRQLAKTPHCPGFFNGFYSYFCWTFIFSLVLYLLRCQVPPLECCTNVSWLIYWWSVEMLHLQTVVNVFSR